MYHISISFCISLKCFLRFSSLTPLQTYNPFFLVPFLYSTLIFLVTKTPLVFLSYYLKAPSISSSYKFFWNFNRSSESSVNIVITKSSENIMKRIYILKQPLFHFLTVFSLNIHQHS